MYLWLESKHNGFSGEINAGSGEAYKQIDRCVDSGDAGQHFGNRRKTKETVKKVLAAVERLAFVGVKNQSSFSEESGASRAWLRENEHLWIHLVDVYNSNKAIKREMKTLRVDMKTGVV